MKPRLAGAIGGLIGAVTVTTLHECIRHFYSGAPRLDKLGGEAANKAARALGAEPLSGDKLYATSMAGDIVSNAIYYSAAALKPNRTIASGTVLGLLAGVGAVRLPRSMGLDPEPTSGSLSRKLITVGLYTIGGIVSGLIIRRLADHEPGTGSD